LEKEMGNKKDSNNKIGKVKNYGAKLQFFNKNKTLLIKK
jgi:hypothetical protein